MKKNVWGMPTLIELNGIEENLSLCTSLGLDFIELNMNMPEYQPDKIELDRLIYLKDKYNIFYTIHLPEEFDIANFNKYVRDAYEKIFKDTVELAAGLNCPVINMHMNSGVYFTLPSRRIHLYSKYFDEYIDRIKGFGAYAQSLLEDGDIRLCIENTGIYDMDYIRKAVELLLDYDRIYLTWDIGHDRSSGYRDMKFIMDNIDKLKHMHFHDALDKKDHLPLFEGDIDICEKIDIAKKCDCLSVIETKTVEGLRASVDSLLKKGLLG